MIKIYGCNKGLIEIKNDQYTTTVIRVGYSKPNLNVWYIKVEKLGTAKQKLTICNDEESKIYSDIFEIDSEILSHKIVKKDTSIGSKNNYYIFRGKRKDTGEWVKGFYVCLGETFHYILSGKLDLTRSYVTFEKFEIDPTTLGQYIRQIDANGKKIFEGDILKPNNGRVGGRLGTVVFQGGRYSKHCHFGYSVFCGREEIVIGNIFDNPELIK